MDHVGSDGQLSEFIALGSVLEDADNFSGAKDDSILVEAILNTINSGVMEVLDIILQAKKVEINDLANLCFKANPEASLE